MPEEMESELSAQLLVLSFFSSLAMAEVFTRKVAEPDVAVDTVAETFRREFSEAVRGHALLGTSIWTVLSEAEQEGAVSPATASGLPPRNAPCPCGSAKKFKKCCGRPQH